MTMFKRIAVVNRGEAAVRLIRAVRELNAEHDYGIRVDRAAYRRRASRTCSSARQTRASPFAAPAPAAPYLDYGELERALLAAKADAVWVGWGFVAEDPAFAEICAQSSASPSSAPAPTPCGCSATRSRPSCSPRRSASRSPRGRGGPVETRADARRHAQAIGYPLIIKARSGGGGRGIRKVFAEDELELALERTQGEAERSFGDPVVFLERLVTEARHVEVQVIADNHGNVWAPGVRDCSIQRRTRRSSRSPPRR